MDSFAADNLPPRREEWPEFLPIPYPARLNCATELLDRNLATRADHPALITTRRDIDLYGARGAGEPHRQCADG